MSGWSVALGFVLCALIIATFVVVMYRVWKELIDEYVDVVANRRAEEMLRHTKARVSIDTVVTVVDEMHK